VAAAGFLAGGPLLASGPFGTDARLWSTNHVAVSHEQLLAGEPGILDLDYDTNELFIAYRHLSEAGLGPASQRVLGEALWPPAPAGTEPDAPAPDPTATWKAARGRVAGIETIGWLDNFRSVQTTRDGMTEYDFVENCLPDAFRSAAAALDDRVGRFGDASAEARSFVAGQDSVFANCGDPPANRPADAPPVILPPPLPTSASPLVEADRAYHLAAASFYAMQYRDAASRFATIAADATSPWRAAAALGVARSWIRLAQWTRDEPARVEAWATADRQLAALLTNPDLAAFHASVRRLQGFVAARVRPVERQLELRARLLAPSLAALGVDRAGLAQDLHDYLYLAAGAGVSDPAVDDLAAWLAAMRWQRPDAEHPELATTPSPALARWHACRQPPSDAPACATELPWLVAALIASEASSLDPGLRAAAERVSTDSPAYLTVAFHLARLAAESGDDNAARQRLDVLLARSDLARGDRNRLSALRAELATDLDRYLELSQAHPVEVGETDGNIIWTWEGDGCARYREGETVLSAPATTLLNRATTTVELARLAGPASPLSAEYRRRTAIAAWTRALITADDELADQLVPVVGALVPEVANEVAEITAARGDERRFLAALTLLRVPGLQPVVTYDCGRQTPLREIDQVRDNWWCRGGGTDQGDLASPLTVGSGDAVRRLGRPRFLAPEAWQAAQESPPLADLEAGPIDLGQRVLAYARGHRNDSRVPKALQLVVRATRFGCPDWASQEPGAPLSPTGEVSKAAFELLHRWYPDSDEAQQTKYWFQ
jgi:septum formation topological specificity factor MinE